MSFNRYSVQISPKNVKKSSFSYIVMHLFADRLRFNPRHPGNTVFLRKIPDFWSYIYWPFRIYSKKSLLLTRL